MKIIYPPLWMNHYHWLVLATILWTLTAYLAVLYVNYRKQVTLAYVAVKLCLAVICSCFWLIQTETAHIDPVVLFAVERACWFPMLAGIVIVVDVHAAELARRESYLERIYHAVKDRLQPPEEGALER